MRRFLVALFAPLAALVGCDTGISQLKPGVSTAAEVRTVMGNPTFEWKAPDGSMTWEFARGPEGAPCGAVASCARSCPYWKTGSSAR